MSSRFIPVRRFFYYLSPYRIKIFIASVCSVLNNVFDILPDALIGFAVDVVVNRQNSFLAYLGVTNVLEQLYILGGLTLIIWALEAIFEYLSEILWRNLAQTVQHDMRISAYSHLQKLEIAYFEDKNSGELLTILNDDINQLEHFFDKGIIDFIYFLVNITVVTFTFFYLAPLIAFLAFIPVSFIIFISYKFQARLGAMYAQVREQAGMLGARISSNIIGITTIKSYATEEYELARISSDSDAYKRANGVAIGIGAAFIPVIRIAIACGFVITVILGGSYVLSGKLAVGAYSVLVTMTQRLLWPFIYLAKITDVYKRAMACVERVFSVLDEPIGIVDGVEEKCKEAIKGRIEFKNVSFAYSNGEKIFDNLSIAVEPGQTIGIVGATGSGKSTLVKLLLRFYEPTSGSISLDGTEISAYKLKLFRQAFGFVSQDVFLFKGTLRENIAYGFPQATDEQIEYAAKIAEIHSYIMTLPDGYNTIIGERGQNLSGGQRQRISIARAIVNNPPIFVLDEATSSVDNETEASIKRSLDKIAKNHTIFVIAHRLSTVRNADKIVVLHRGSVIENGKHEQLIDRNGPYARLWRAQTGDFLESSY